MTPHVIVIGAGSTGWATAHYVALRGLRITVIERGEVAFATTGRNHCLLHSGGRYCVTDQESAIECRRIITRVLKWLGVVTVPYGFLRTFTFGPVNLRIALPF
jgi:glycerol-3-phosphate dehydrogenase